MALSFDAAEWTSEMDKLHANAENLGAYANEAAVFKATVGLVDETDAPAPKVQII